MDGVVVGLSMAIAGCVTILVGAAGMVVGLVANGPSVQPADWTVYVVVFGLVVMVLGGLCAFISDP